MLMKAIIESYPDKNSQVRIRIPKYHKLNGVAASTPTNELPLASICYLPGILPTYNPGDIVFVEFENDDISLPVILGKLLRKKDSSNSWCNIKTQSLEVDIDTKLSEDTILGKISYNDL